MDLLNSIVMSCQSEIASVIVTVVIGTITVGSYPPNASLYSPLDTVGIVLDWANYWYSINLLQHFPRYQTY
jgi:hypothetical protein